MHLLDPAAVAAADSCRLLQGVLEFGNQTVWEALALHCSTRPVKAVAQTNEKHTTAMSTTDSGQQTLLLAPETWQLVWLQFS